MADTARRSLSCAASTNPASPIYPARSGMELIYVYENGQWGMTPVILLQAEHGEVVYRAERIPHWLAGSLARL